MISHRHRAIFFHVGKAAGTSIERWLVPAVLDPTKPNRKLLFGWDPHEGIYLQHATCATIRRLVGAETFDAYYKLTVVREPYARLRSVYLYAGHAYDRFGGFRGFVLALPEEVCRPGHRNGSHLLAQTAYTDLDGERVVDQVVRFEHLEQGLGPVGRHLGIDRPLGHVNRRGPKGPLAERPLAEVYDADMIEAMQAVYAGDFLAFGYPDRPA